MRRRPSMNDRNTAYKAFIKTQTSADRGHRATTTTSLNIFPCRDDSKYMTMCHLLLSFNLFPFFSHARYCRPPSFCPSVDFPSPQTYLPQKCQCQHPTETRRVAHHNHDGKEHARRLNLTCSICMLVFI